MAWRDTIGYRMCDSEFADAQIEWQIVRLSPSAPFDHSIPAEPKYAPFVAAGFYFTYGDVLAEVSCNMRNYEGDMSKSSVRDLS